MPPAYNPLPLFELELELEVEVEVEVELTFAKEPRHIRASRVSIRTAAVTVGLATFFFSFPPNPSGVLRGRKYKR